jgi:DTW domain-containing protein
MTDRCERCLWQQRVCLCASIPTVPTRTRVVIVRHRSERTRTSNSGRLAHLALPNSVIVDHGGLEGPAILPPLVGAWLVFPEGPPVEEIAGDPPEQIVVLDATWSQARRMFRKIDGLRGLPLFRLEASSLPARLRASPAPDRVSTIEAIARALRIVEGEHVAQPLEALFALAVERAVMMGRSVHGAIETEPEIGK